VVSAIMQLECDSRETRNGKVLCMYGASQLPQSGSHLISQLKLAPPK